MASAILEASLIRSLVIVQGIRTSITKTPYSFMIFQWGEGPDPLSTPLDRRMAVPFFC